MSNTSIKTPYVIWAQLTGDIIEEPCTKHINLGVYQITLSLLSVTSRFQYSVSCSWFGLGASGFCSFVLLSTSLLLDWGGVLGWHWVSDPPLGGAFLPWPTFSLWWKQLVGICWLKDANQTLLWNVSSFRPFFHSIFTLITCKGKDSLLSTCKEYCCNQKLQ